MVNRFKRTGKRRLVLLIVSDFDPEGEDIAHSFARSLRDDFDVTSIHPIKVALTREQVAEMRLPPQMKAKEGSSRRKKFVERNGDDVFELEAIPPERLQQILRATIDGVIDTEGFNREIEQEKRDAQHLHGVRRATHATLSKITQDEENE
jgi:hypothetical protein